ncbi:MAG: EamA family transporter [Actinomycetota bacterium]
MAALLALGAALGWGSSDYAAGVASRRSHPMSVVLLAHLLSALALLCVLLAVGTGVAGADDLALGAAAGLGGGLGALLLFRGLAIGQMGVVAPITAAGAAVIPVGYGLVTGDALGRLTIVGVGVALVAVGLISGVDLAALRRTPAAVGAGARPLSPILPAPAGSSIGLGAAFGAVARRPGVLDALGSGVGFGAFFVLLSRTSEDAGLWPLVSARGMSVVAMVAVAVATGVQIAQDRDARVHTVVAGVLDAVAAALFLLASRDANLAVVSVLASLYPLATAGLARLIDHEQLSRLQLAGIGLAGVAVALISIG